MKPLALFKSELDGFLKELSRDFDIFGPKRQKKGYLDWGEIEGLSDLDLSPGVTKTSVKSFFLPQPEVLFEFSKRAGEERAFRLKEPNCPDRKRVLFGVRPCDARSIYLNSMPYKDDCYFQKNIERNIVIGLFCKAHLSTCFCTWVGGSPTSTDGMDIGVYELEDSFIFLPLSQRGQELLRDKGLREIGQKEEEQIDAYKNHAPEGILEGVDIAKEFSQKSLFDLYDARFWQEVTDPCLNCGTCTFLCPTCYCFDIQDEVLRGKGRRIRYWDSCMFPLFTLHASGHNPRGEKLKRVRNRFMHKLKYFPDRFGPISCVGCGRCVRDCPVSIDIRQVIRQFLEI